MRAWLYSVECVCGCTVLGVCVWLYGAGCVGVGVGVWLYISGVYVCGCTVCVCVWLYSVRGVCVCVCGCTVSGVCVCVCVCVWLYAGRSLPGLALSEDTALSALTQQGPPPTPSSESDA